MSREFVVVSLFCDNCSYAKPSVPPLPHDRSFWIISAWSTHWRYARVCPPFMKELLTLVRIGAADGDCPAGDDSP